MNEASHETWPTTFRKKVKAVSALATIVGQVIFRPPPGTQFVLAKAYAKIRRVVGTVSDAPNIAISNGTTPTVAAVDLLIAEGAVQRLTVTGNVVIDYDHPLTLASADAQNGGTVFDYDLILFVDKISD